MERSGVMWRRVWGGVIDFLVMGAFVGLCAGLTLVFGA
jgi:hypothetical protein